MARRLVQVDVDADHEVERGERAREARRVRRAHGGIARDRDQRAHLTLARRLDLLGEARARELAEHLGRAAHAALVAVQAHARAHAGLAARVGRERGGLREHRAAGPVELAREHVQHVDEPARRGAELGGGGADPAVDAAAVRGRELAREAPDHVGRARRSAARPARARTARSRGARRRRRSSTRRAGPSVTRSSAKSACTMPASSSASVPGRIGDVLVGDRGGLAAARIDHHEPAAALAHAPHAAAEVRHREQAAVRGHRVRAEHQAGSGVRSMSGTGIAERARRTSGATATCFGYWSTVLALKRLRLRKPVSSAWL